LSRKQNKRLSHSDLNHQAPLDDASNVQAYSVYPTEQAEGEEKTREYAEKKKRNVGRASLLEGLFTLVGEEEDMSSNERRTRRSGRDEEDARRSASDDDRSQYQWWLLRKRL